jgi:DNA-binding transcriptional MerR regulator
MLFGTTPTNMSEADRNCKSCSSALKTIMTRYSTAQVAAAAGVARTALDTWLLRGVIPPVPKAGQGAARQFSFVDAVRIAAIAAIERHGLPVSAAGDLMRRVDEAFARAVEERGEPAVLLLARGGASIIPRTGMIRMWQNLERGDHRRDFPTVHTALDLTRLVHEVRAALERPGHVFRWEGGSGEVVDVVVETQEPEDVPQSLRKRRNPRRHN